MGKKDISLDAIMVLFALIVLAIFMYMYFANPCSLPASYISADKLANCLNKSHE